MNSWELLFAVIPGIILFLYGIEQFSHEVQVAGGEYFRNLIQRLTKTPIRGTAAGALVTAVVQSSTATTVITVGLVNAGVISFMASLGIIFGANLGSTMTSQLVALNLTAFAPILILAGFLISIIGGKYRVFGRPIFYFGLVFFSLSLISTVMVPYRTDPQLIELMGLMDTVFLQIAFGFLITNIFQSSSVTTGLVVVMSQNDLITPTVAIPILLGANLGTPTTALLVATRMNTSARRVAVAHFLFNFLGVLLFLPILGLFTAFVLSLGGDPAQQVANAHLLFNLTCCIVFLILVHPFGRLVQRLVPGREDDIVFVPRILHDPPPAATPEAFHMIEQEIVHILELSRELLAESRLMLDSPDRKNPRIQQLRNYAGFLDKQVNETALVISQRDLNEDDAEYVAGIVRVSTLADVLASQTRGLCTILEQLYEKGISITPESAGAIRHSLVPYEKNLEALIAAFPAIPDDVNEAMRAQDEHLRDEMTGQYLRYLSRLSSHQSPAGSDISRALFQVEGMAATVREIRKSLRRLQRVNMRP
jgi:phosphate:Na+ symporter